MPWYIFALVDEVPAGAPGKGLGGTLAVHKIPGGLAIVERRADVPPVEFGTLEKHQAVVSRLAERVPAILPVRFGTLLEAEEIDEALEDRDEEIAEAFDVVRGRVQFTWRTSSRRKAEGGREGRQHKAADSGTEYLQRAARAAKPAPPAAFRTLRSKVGPLIAGERYQLATPQLPAALYHLVDASAIERYQVIAEAVCHAAPLLAMTGPFPPFAFAPEIL
jgi:hypothetical protein